MSTFVDVKRAEAIALIPSITDRAIRSRLDAYGPAEPGSYQRAVAAEAERRGIAVDSDPTPAHGIARPDRDGRVCADCGRGIVLRGFRASSGVPVSRWLPVDESAPLECPSRSGWFCRVASAPPVGAVA